MDETTTQQPLLAFPTLPNGAQVIGMVGSSRVPGSVAILCRLQSGELVSWMANAEDGTAYWGRYGDEALPAFIERIEREV